MWLLASLISLSLFLNGCTSGNAQFLKEATGHMTQEGITSKWGSPHEKNVIDTGEMWTYNFPRFDSMEHPVTCEGYKLRFDKERVLRDWSEFYC